MTTQQTEATSNKRSLATRNSSFAQEFAEIHGATELRRAAFDFWDDRYEGRRLFSEVLGTFLLVLVAVGGSLVDARFPAPSPWPSVWWPRA